MTVNQLVEKLQQLQKQDLGDFEIHLSKYQDRPFGWEFFTLDDIGYSEHVVIINIDEN